MDIALTAFGAAIMFGLMMRLVDQFRFRIMETNLLSRVF